MLSAVLRFLLLCCLVFVTTSPELGLAKPLICHQLFRDPIDRSIAKNTLAKHELLGKYSSLLFKIYDEYRNLIESDWVYSRVDDIGDSKVTKQSELDSLFRILFFDQTESAIFSHLNRWIKSKDHALFLYEVIGKAKSPFLNKVLEMIMQNHPLYKDTHYGLSYSFEKEDKPGAKGTAGWYRIAKYDESSWNKLDPNFRGQMLYEEIWNNSQGAIPTSSKPPYLSKLVVDIPTLEVKHKAFELELDTAFKQLHEVAGANGNTHSIHFHIVFFLPLDYPLNHQKSFFRWIKQQNDKLLFLGLEEGLHSNRYTGIVVTGDVKEKDDGGLSLSTLSLPSDFYHLFSAKFGNLGFRSGTTYSNTMGNDNRIDHYVFGLEFRDSTRDLAKLRKVVEEVKDDLLKRAWEKDTIEDIQSNRCYVIPHGNNREIFNTKFDFNFDSYFKEFFIKNPTLLLPFNDFEHSNFYDYKSQKIKRLSADQKARVLSARDEYIRDIQATHSEFLQSLGNKGYDNLTYDELEIIVVAALKWSLADWARKVKPSNFF